MTAAPPRARTVLAALGAVLALAGGCTTNASSSVGDGGSFAGPFGVQSCDFDGHTPQTPPSFARLPADSMLVSATRCLFEPQPVPGDGEWLIRTEQTATSGLDALATALRLPSEKARTGQACTLIGYLPIVITVTDTAGREIHPEIPQAACGGPLKATTDAIATVPWTQVSTTKIRQLRSELEISSGCPGLYKPMIAIIAAEGSQTEMVTPNTAATALRVCRYDLDPDPANALSLSNGTSYRAGKLASASTMDTAAGGELLAAIASAPKATSACTQPESPFAVVHPLGDKGPSPWFTVERGGCNRVMLDSDNVLRQLDAALVTRLVG